jgi:hypothetical protein
MRKFTNEGIGSFVLLVVYLLVVICSLAWLGFLIWIGILIIKALGKYLGS